MLASPTRHWRQGKLRQQKTQRHEPIATQGTLALRDDVASGYTKLNDATEIQALFVALRVLNTLIRPCETY